MNIKFKTPRFNGSKSTGDKKPSRKKKAQKTETVAGNGTIQQSHASTLGRYGIWALLLAAVLFGLIGSTLGGLAVFSNPAKSFAQEIEKQNTETVIADNAAAYAQGYLTSYLGANKDNSKELAAYIGEDAASRAVQKVASAVEFRNPVVASVEKTRYDYYSTKIQVEQKQVTKAQVNGEEKEVTSWDVHWYKVVVAADSNGKYTPVGFPSATNPPSTNQNTTEYPFSVTNTEVTGAVGDFGKAYLAETGDINRYISPEATISAIKPAPYTEVALINLTGLKNLDGAVPADGTKEYVLAQYEVTDQGGNVRNQTYPLEITARGGRWEISTIERSPHTY